MANTPISSGSTTQTNRVGQTDPAKPDLAADAGALMDEARSAAGKVADEAMEQVSTFADRA